LHRGEAPQGGVTYEILSDPPGQKDGVSSSVPEKVQASVRSGKPPPQKGTFSAFSALLFFAGAKVFA